eukprot:10591003-Lingulodinium_polyedra.AAC.1
MKSTSASPEVVRKYRERIRRLVGRRKKGYVPATPSATRNPVVKTWPMDTGCGHDLITRSDAMKMKEFIRRASTSVNFNTANRSARGTEVVD